MCDVLIVDDDPETSAILSSAIALNGYRPEWADGGSRALSLFGDGLRPALVLLDLSMPGMSGIDVALRMKADPELNGIPIVFASGQRLSSSAARIRLSEVMTIVKRYLDRPPA